MKYLLTALFIIFSLSAFSQGGWLRPNTSYGTRSYRAAFDSTLFFPTGCGTPSLRLGTGGISANLKMGTIYFDSCNHKFYIYDPQADAWINTSGIDSTLLATKYGVDTAKQNIRNQIINLNNGKFIISGTPPIDTTVNWIDTTYKRLFAAPIRYRINGAWSLVDTISGPHYDFIGGVISNGPPIKIGVSGQSNPGGPYASNLIIPPFYDGTVGDTTASPYVTGWNDSTGKWEIGRIKGYDLSSTNGGPWQYSTGENYVFDLAKLMAKQYGRSVRVVSDIHGGQPLNKWAGNISGISDTAIYFLTLKNKMIRSGIGKPDYFIWGHGESGLDSSGKNNIYYGDKLLQLIASLRSNALLDTTRTIFITSTLGDTIQRKPVAVAVTSSEGGLRMINMDGDKSSAYVDVISAQSDGLHYTWRGHRVIAMRLFGTILQMPKILEDTLYKRTSAELVKKVLDSSKLIVQSSRFTDINGTPYIDFAPGLTLYQTPNMAAGATTLPGITLNSSNLNAIFQGFNGETMRSDNLNRWAFNKKINVAVGGMEVGGGNYDGFSGRMSISTSSGSPAKEFHLHPDNGGALTMFNGGNLAEIGFKYDFRGGKFQLRSNAGSPTGSNYLLRIANTPTTSPSPGVGVGIDFQQRWNSDNDTTHRTYAQITSIATDTTRASAKGDLTLNVISNGNLSEKIRIKSDGKVGIGISTPTQALHVAGQTRIDTLLDGVGGTDSIVTVKNGVLQKVAPSSIIPAAPTSQYANWTWNGSQTLTPGGAIISGLTGGSMGTTSGSWTYSGGKLTYTGATTKMCFVIVTTLYAGTSGNSVQTRIAKNGSNISNTSVTSYITSGGVSNSISTQYLISLSTNDYIELWADGAATESIGLINLTAHSVN